MLWASHCSSPHILHSWRNDVATRSGVTLHYGLIRFGPFHRGLMVLGKIITNLHAGAGSRTRVFMEIKLELVITPVTLFFKQQ